jgi:hypothetical protein
MKPDYRKLSFKCGIEIDLTQPLRKVDQRCSMRFLQSLSCTDDFFRRIMQ